MVTFERRIRLPRSHALKWLVLATAVLSVAEVVPLERHGLHATYFSGPDWQSGHEQAEVLDNPPSTGAIKRQRPDFAEHPFSVEWRGFLEVRRTGTYRFVIKSDDGAALYIRGKRIVDHPGRHPLVPGAEGEVPLDEGIHSVLIRYFQDGEECGFEALWARNGEPLAAVPSSAWLADRPSDTVLMLRRVSNAGWTLISLAWLGCPLVWAGRWTLRTARRHVEFEDGTVNPALGGVVLISTLLNACGLWWALPNQRGWAQDELVPIDVLNALSKRFAEGWASKYPPLHFEVLSLAYSPLLLLSWFGRVDLETPAIYLALFVIGRVVSLMCAAGIVVVIYLCGRELYGEIGAVFAAMSAALMAPFVYYGKLTNLEAPYLFWFAVSLLAYIRILKHHRRGDYLVFAACSALAVSTKDQAYGLALGTWLAILAARWRQRSVDASAKSVVIDRTVVAAGGLAVAVFTVAHNLVLNYSGFIAHVTILLGPASADYRVFPGTVVGQWHMASKALLELTYIFGWPLTAVVAIGLVWACTRARTSPSLLWLLIPPLCYYATFIGVVLYFYDRFLLPIGLVLALFAGGWLERFLAPGRRWRAGLVAMVFVYSFVYAAAVDHAMVTDSRYYITQWVKERLGPDDVVASRGPLEYFMLANGIPAASAQSFDNIMVVRPAFIVLNADTARLDPDDPWRAVWDRLNGSEGGYRLGLRYRTRPLPWLIGHPDLSDGGRLRSVSSLATINPTIDVFVRADVMDRPPARRAR